MTKRRGHPPLVEGESTVLVTVRMPTTMYAAVAATAAAAGVPIAPFVRTAVVQAVTAASRPVGVATPAGRPVAVTVPSSVK